MNLLRNLFAIFGLVSFIGIVLIVVWAGPSLSKLTEFDREAQQTYADMARKLIESGNAAEATIWKAKVKENLTKEDVEDAIRSTANELNIRNVGELPLSTQVEAMTGKKWRYMKIFMFCNPLTAQKMVNYSDAYSAYLPCRLTLLEDKEGNMWIYTVNMDMMIHGGKPLPLDVKREAIQVKTVIQDIMSRGAAGEF